MRYARIGIGVLAAHLGCTESDLHVVNTPPLAEVAPIEVPLRHYSNISIPVAGTIWDREQTIDELSANSDA